MAKWCKVPIRLVNHTLGFLEARELAACQGICKTWKSPPDLLDLQWRYMYGRDVGTMASEDKETWQQRYRAHYTTNRAWKQGKYTARLTVDEFPGGGQACMSVTPNGQFLVASRETTLAVFDLATKKLVDRVQTGHVVALACSPDSSLVFASDSVGRVRSWSLPNLVPVVPGPRSADLPRLSPAGTESQGVVAEFKQGQPGVALTNLLTDGKFLVGWGANKRRFADVVVWETATCRQLWSIGYGCGWSASPAVDWSTERVYAWDDVQGLLEYDLLKGTLLRKTRLVGNVQTAAMCVDAKRQELLIVLKKAQINGQYIAVFDCKTLYLERYVKLPRASSEWDQISIQGDVVVCRGQGGCIVLDRSNWEPCFQLPSAEMEAADKASGFRSTSWNVATVSPLGIYCLSHTFRGPDRILCCEFTEAARTNAHGLALVDKQKNGSGWFWSLFGL